MVTTNLNELIAEGQKALDGWKAIDPNMVIGSFKQADFQTDLQQAAALITQLDDLEARLIDLRNQRDAMGDKIWDETKRVKMGIKAIYGDDSSEYEMIGGTRTSDRKKAPRAKPAT